MTSTENRSDYIFINFVKYIGLWGAVSTILTVGSLVLILTRGLNYGIDFSGGVEVQVRFTQPVAIDEVRSFTNEMGLPNAGVQQFGGESNEYLIRLEAKDQGSEKKTNEKLTEVLSNLRAGVVQKWPTAEIRRVDTVGPQVGKQLKRNGVLATFYSLLVILIYVALRFDYKYAPGAVLCLFHDSVVTLGLFSILQKEVNIQIMAAVLTIIGYSLNDTIIIFDRIRENSAKFKGKSIGDIINTSINETLNRTVLTSFTVLLATLSLYLFAGGVLEDFAFAMLVGILLGAYSTVYVASPFILVLDKFKKAPYISPSRKPAKA